MALPLLAKSFLSLIEYALYFQDRGTVAELKQAVIITQTLNQPTPLGRYVKLLLLSNMPNRAKRQAIKTENIRILVINSLCLLQTILLLRVH